VAQGYWAMGAPDERVRILAGASSRFPSDLTVRAWLAMAELDAHRPKDALEAVQDIVPENSTPAIAEEVRSVRIRALWESGLRAKALREADEAVHLNPEAFWAYLLATNYSEGAGHYDQALEYLARGMRFRPGWNDSDLNAWHDRLIQERDRQGTDADAVARAVGADNPLGGRDSLGAPSDSGGRTGGRNSRRRLDPVTNSDLMAIERMSYR
jgi:tetratricopeptide (TPR) repeat protein